MQWDDEWLALAPNKLQHVLACLLIALAAARRLPRGLRLLFHHRFTTSSSGPSFGSSETSSAPVWDPQSPVRTPPDEQFAAWVTRLRPGFTACDLRSRSNSVKHWKQQTNRLIVPLALR